MQLTKPSDLKSGGLHCVRDMIGSSSLKHPAISSHENPGHDLSGFRIGFFTSVSGMGGSEVVMADSLKAAVSVGAKVTCWSPPGAAINELLKEDDISGRFETHCWPCVSSPHSKAPAVSSIRTPSIHQARRTSLSTALKRLFLRCAPQPVLRLLGFLRDGRRFAAALNKHPVDLLVVNVNGSEAAAWGTGKYTQTPVVGCYHLTPEPYVGSVLGSFIDRCMKRLTSRSCKRMIHVSHGAKNQWCSFFRTDDRDCSVIYNGVSSGKVEPVSRDELGCRGAGFVFAVAARLDPIKGLNHLFDAISDARDSLSECVFLICGSGSEETALRQQARELGIEKHIRMLGWRADVPRVLGAADCTVLPSIRSENFSLSVLEAASLGIPSIVTSVGGMPEAVLHGKTGLVVPPRDAVALGEALSYMANNPTDAKSMGGAAQARVLSEFTLGRMKSKYLECFGELLGLEVKREA